MMFEWIDPDDDWAFAYLPYDDEPLRSTGDTMVGSASLAGEKLLENVLTTGTKLGALHK